MKKVLFATTALVAFAGAASAEVSLSGDAEMGIVGGDVAGDTQFWQTFDVTFTGSGETDYDLTFGAVVDLTEAGGNEDSTNDNGYRVFVSGSFGNLTLGDTDGAMDWALAEANSTSPGSIADDDSAHAGYVHGSYLDGFNDGPFWGFDPASGGDGQILRYDNSFGNIGVAVSIEQGANGATDAGMAVGVKAEFNGINIGAGYQKAAESANLIGVGTPTAIGASVSGDFGGGFSAVAMYTQFSDYWYIPGLDATNMQIGVGFSNGPLSLHANYGQFELDGAPTKSDGFGVAAAYDFGGGLSANLGYGDGTDMFGVSASTWSAGFVMSF